MTTHTYTAADELDRRVANRALEAAGQPKDPAPQSDEGRRLMNLSAAELRAEAGRQEPTPVERKTARKQARKQVQERTRLTPQAKARKPERTPAQQAATAARSKAWAWYIAERQAGRKPTYVAACAKFGTTPAKAAR
jgi:hypothetical protein